MFTLRRSHLSLALQICALGLALSTCSAHASDASTRIVAESLSKLPSDCQEMQIYFEKLGSIPEGRLKNTNPDVQAAHSWFSDRFVRIISLNKTDPMRAREQVMRFKTCAKLIRQETVTAALGKGIPAKIELEQEKYEYIYLTQYIAHGMDKAAGKALDLSAYSNRNREHGLKMAGISAASATGTGVMSYVLGAVVATLIATPTTGAIAVVSGSVAGGLAAAMAGVVLGDSLNYLDQAAGNPVKDSVTGFLQQYVFGGPSEARRIRDSADVMATVLLGAYKSGRR